LLRLSRTTIACTGAIAAVAALQVLTSDAHPAAADAQPRNVILRFSYEFRPMPLDLVQPASISLLSDTYYGELTWPSFGGPTAQGNGFLSHRDIRCHRRRHSRKRKLRCHAIQQHQAQITLVATQPIACPDGTTIYGRLDVSSSVPVANPLANTTYTFPCNGTGHEKGATSSP
jgi:hypothetical protein